MNMQITGNFNEKGESFMCKKEYVKPEMNPVVFVQDDVVRTSDPMNPYETEEDNF